MISLDIDNITKLERSGLDPVTKHSFEFLITFNKVAKMKRPLSFAVVVAFAALVYMVARNPPQTTPTTTSSSQTQSDPEMVKPTKPADTKQNQLTDITSYAEVRTR